MNEDRDRLSSGGGSSHHGPRRALPAVIGALIGGVLGSLLGSAIAGFNGGVIGAILGALLGAMIGASSVGAGGRKQAGLHERTESHPVAATDRDLSRDVSLSRRTDGEASSKAIRAASGQPDRSDVVRVPLAEERLEVDKRELEAGLVRLRKVVKTEIVHMPVELRREEIIVERVEAGGASTGGAGEPHVFGDQHGDEIVIPLVKEEAVVQKESKVFSEVHVHKVTHTETKQIQETVRREEVVVDQPGRERGS